MSAGPFLFFCPCSGPSDSATCRPSSARRTRSWCKWMTLTRRRVEGEIRSKRHDDKTAVFEGTTIPLRRWEDWEKSRLRKLKREERRRREFERQFGPAGAFLGDDGSGSSNGHGGGFDGVGMGIQPSRSWVRSEYESDAGSVFSTDEDVWGAEIGGVSGISPSLIPSVPNQGGMSYA